MDIPTILTTILSPTTPNEARRFAHEQLEMFKMRKDALETCFRMFIQEMSGERRQVLLHFCLRTCYDLVHTKYSNMSMEEMNQIKATTLNILSIYLPQVSPLVEGAGIELAVEILKQDVDASGFFEQISSGLKNPTWCRVSCDVISSFSETLVVEDEDALVSTRRTKLTRFFSTIANQVLAACLDIIQQAIQQGSDEQTIKSALKVCNECLRWHEPLPMQSERLLRAISTCANDTLTVSMTCAALKCLSSLCSCKPADLEKSRIPVNALYDLVRRVAIIRAPFRNDEELYAGSEVVLSLFNKHFAALHTLPTFVQDLERFTASNNPYVLADALEVWKHLLHSNAIELNEEMVTTILHQCVTCPKSQGEEDEEEDVRSSAVKELVKRRPDITCPVAVNLINALCVNKRWKEVWFLVESVSNGLSPKHLEQFQKKDITSPPFVTVLENMIELLFKVCQETKPIPVEKLKVLHACHRLFEIRSNYLGIALDFFASSALYDQEPSNYQASRKLIDLRKRAAALFLSILRRVSAKKIDDAFLATAVLPALIQRVSAAFGRLQGPERFVLLECILVAGKALPREEDRIELARNVLTKPFQNFASLGGDVLSNLLAEIPAGSTALINVPWDTRGYFEDTSFLPEKSKQVAYALMTLSTCSQDGSLSQDMWAQLVPLAVESLLKVDSLWASFRPPNEEWALVIHPVDAKCMLGTRLAETMENFIEGMNEFGETVLGVGRMAVIAFISSIRSCSLELLKNASVKAPPRILQRAHCEKILQGITTMEHRHLAAVLNSIPLFDIDAVLFDQVIQHITDRLRAPQNNPSWRVRVYPGCESALAEEIQDAARCSLELAFAKSLRTSCRLDDNSMIPDSRLNAIAERLVLGDEATVRHAAGTILERCLTKTSTTLLCRIVLRACLAAYVKWDGREDVDVRPILDLVVETLSRVMLGCTLKEIGKVKPSQEKRKAPIAELAEVFGQSLVNKFVEEVNGVKSEKAFKGSVVDLIENAAFAHKPSSSTTTSITMGGAATSSSSSSGNKKKKKKKKSKQGKGVSAEDDDGMAIVQATTTKSYPTWHDATNARDLGTLLLFNGGKEEDQFDDL